MNEQPEITTSSGVTGTVISIIKHRKPIILIQLSVLISGLISGCTTDPHNYMAQQPAPKKQMFTIPKNTPKGEIPIQYLAEQQSYNEQFMRDPAARSGSEKFISLTTTYGRYADNTTGTGYTIQLAKYGRFTKETTESEDSTLENISIYGGFASLYKKINEYEFKIDFHNGDSFDTGVPRTLTIYEKTVTRDAHNEMKNNSIRNCLRGKEIIASKYIQNLPGKIYIYECTANVSSAGSFEHGNEGQYNAAYSDYLNILLPSSYTNETKKGMEKFNPLSGSITFIDDSGQTITTTIKLQ